MNESFRQVLGICESGRVAMLENSATGGHRVIATEEWRSQARSAASRMIRIQLRFDKFPSNPELERWDPWMLLLVMCDDDMVTQIH